MADPQAPTQNNANSVIQAPQGTLSIIEQERIPAWREKRGKENADFSYKIRETEDVIRGIYPVVTIGPLEGLRRIDE